MRLLRFKSQNLFSIGQAVLELDKRGLLLITGFSKDDNTANGSGKSTLASKGIMWTLFGQTAGGQRGDEAINVHGTDDTTRGEVVFRGTDDAKYHVIRTRRPDALKFLRDAEALTRRNSRETQELINTSLGRNFDTFLQTDFFGQGREKSFLALTSGQQAEVLEDILPVATVGDWATEAKVNKATVQEEYDTVSLAMSKTEGRLHEAEIAHSRSESNFAQWETNKKESLKKLTGNVDTYSREMELRAQIKFQELNNYPSIETVIATIENFQNELGELSTKEYDLKIDLASVERESSQLQGKLMNIPEDTCPTCEQSVKSDVTDKLIHDQHSLRSKVKDLEDKSTIVERRLRNNTESVLCLGREIVNEKELLHSIKLLETRRGALASLDTVQEQIEHLKNAPNPHAREAEYTKKRAKTLYQEHAQKDAKVQKLNEELTHLTFWGEAFSKKFKNYLFKKACPYLEYRTSQHLKGLGNSQLQVTFSTAKLLKSGDPRSEFNVNVTSRTGGSSYAALSGGEQKIASFGVGMALADLAESQVQGSSHFLILDEPFEYLQGKNCENLVSYLTNELTKRRETILLVSNDDSLKQLVPNRLHVVKENGRTSIEYEMG